MPPNMDNPEPPCATFVLLTYNQERYVAHALEAALAQTYQPMEIIVSDDASTDGTLQIVRRIAGAYRGPHEVTINANPANLGIGRHVNKVFRLARGEFVFLAAGDDISSPDRVERVIRFWLSRNKAPSAIFCAAKAMNEAGQITGHYAQDLGRSARGAASLIRRFHRPPPLLRGACSAYSPDVMTVFGELAASTGIEDTPLALRASLLGGVEFLDEELVRYRVDSSGWLQRNTGDPSFSRHLVRMRESEQMTRHVFLQIDADVTKHGRQELASLARKRIRATEYLIECLDGHGFSLPRHFRVAWQTGEWKALFFRGTLYSFPRFYQALLALKHGLQARFGISLARRRNL